MILNSDCDIWIEFATTHADDSTFLPTKIPKQYLGFIVNVVLVLDVTQFYY